jgi:acyl carrier protein
MNTADLISKLETTLDAAPGSIQENQALGDIPQWDSLAVVAFMALADSDYGKKVTPAAITSCRSVADLIKLVT